MLSNGGGQGFNRNSHPAPDAPRWRSKLPAELSTHGYGRLYVLLQRRFHLEWLLDVPPAAFNPAPKVDSAVVRLIPKAAAEIVPLDEALFSRVVLTAFSQRRKTLRNTLSGLLDAEGFSALGIDAGQRAENLSLSNYQKITLHLMQRGA